MRLRILVVVAAVWLLGYPAPASTAPIDIGGVHFPGGMASFADVVVAYTPNIHNGQPLAQYRNPANAVGAPDSGGNVSLGDGGSIILRFTDNSLTGSGSPALDLWIFEVGPDVEDTFVRISKDGVIWTDVGKVFGATSGIDVDAFGVHAGDYYSFVELTDDTNEGDQVGASVGADIDAVGAISSAPPVTMPEPALMCLLVLGGAAAVLRRHS